MSKYFAYTAAILVGIGGSLFAARGDAPQTLRSPDPVQSLSFSPDGRWLLAGSSGRAHVLRVPETGGVATKQSYGHGWTAPDCALQDARFSPDSLYVVSGRRECRGGDVIVHQAFGDAPIRLAPERAVIAELELIAFSTTGRRLLAVDRDGRVRIWSLADRTLSRTLQLPAFAERRDFVRAFAVSPDLDILALWNWRDNYMLLVDVERGELLHRTEYPFRPEEQPLFVFSRDGARYFDGRRVRDSRSGDPVTVIEFNFATVPVRAAFHPDGESLALVQQDRGAGTSSVESYRLSDGALVRSRVVSGRLHALDFDADGKTLAAGAWDGTIYFWNLSPDS